MDDHGNLPDHHDDSEAALARLREIFGTGKIDQLEAARADARRLTDKMAAGGARVRLSMPDELPPRARELYDLYQRACDEARARYEQATPEADWVPGRLRWAHCTHVSASPQVVHWYSVWPEMIVCERCAPEDKQCCYRCGRHDHRLTSVTLSDPHAPVLLHADLCDACHPEGADAPAIQT